MSNLITIILNPLSGTRILDPVHKLCIAVGEGVVLRLMSENKGYSILEGGTRGDLKF